MKAIAIILISLYQKTRLFRVRCCRFYPSCSQYSKLAIEKHGIVSGILLTLMRLLRCNPFNYGGVDEVPVKLASPREVYLLVLKNWKYKSWT